MKSILFTFILISFVVVSCKKKNTQTMSNPPITSTMTCELNGNTWTANVFNSKLKIISDQNSTVKRLDLSGQDGTYAITLTCFPETSSLNNTEDIPVGIYQSDTQFEALMAMTQGFSPVGFAEGDLGSTITIQIISIDASVHTCSGTFSFTAYDPMNQDSISFTATNGAFSDLNYIVF